MELSNKIFNRNRLNAFYLRLFRREAKMMYQVWKLETGFFLAIEVCPNSDSNSHYARETKYYGNDGKGARLECDRLRREYITSKVKEMKTVRKVY